MPTSDSGLSFAAEFKLSITRALAHQLMVSLDELTPTALTEENLERLERRGGVYELFKDDDVVYVGKAERNLAHRLRQHKTKISGRENVSVDQIMFRCLYVDDDLQAVAPERMLISEYTGRGKAPWNTSGYGNNDPGRNRDHSEVEATHFDALFPADLSYPLTVRRGNWDAQSLLAKVKSDLPWVLRYADSAQDRQERSNIQVHIPDDTMTAAELLTHIMERLPSKYQATALPGYVIVYAERENYPSARRYWYKDTSGTLHVEDVSPTFRS